MPTVFSHAVAAIALATPFGGRETPRHLYYLGAVSAVLPDLDVIGFRLGIPYGHPLGHRGLSHSLAFAAVWAALLAWGAFRSDADRSRRGRYWLYLFLATASHGILDALTSGGSGVAFFAPLWNERYFFPWTPILVSPLSIDRFFTERGARVMASEFAWVWLPSAAFAIVVLAARRRGSSGGATARRAR